MGKGDKKSRRGKIIRGSYGKTRPGRSKPTHIPAVAEKVEKTEKVKEEVVVEIEEPKVVEKTAKPKTTKAKEKKEPKAKESAPETKTTKKSDTDEPEAATS